MFEQNKNSEAIKFRISTFITDRDLLVACLLLVRVQDESSPEFISLDPARGYMNTNNRLSWLCRLGTSVVCVTASAASDHQEDVRGRGKEKKTCTYASYPCQSVIAIKLNQ